MKLSKTSWLIGLGAILLGTAVMAAEPSFRIVYTPVGSRAEDVTAGAAERFAAAADARKGMRASFTGQRADADAFLAPPRGTGNDPWISLVCVTFGERRDWLALLCRGESPIMAVHRSASTRNRGAARWDRVPIGPYQISTNATRELAADFAHAFTAATLTRELPTVQVSVVPWEGEPKPGDLLADDDAGGGLVSQSGSASAEALTGFQALAFAGISQAGWQPVEQAPARLRFMVAHTPPDHYTVRVVFTDAKGSTTHTEYDLVHDKMYELLRALCRKMLNWRGNVRDVARLGVAAHQPLLYANGKLVVQSGQTLQALTALNGKTAWEVLPGIKSRPKHFVRGETPGPPTLLRLVGSGLAQVNLDTGKQKAVAKAAPTPASAIAVVDDGVAVITGTALSLHREETAVWRVEEKAKLAAGPAVWQDRVVVGAEEGSLICRSVGDGKELWRQTTGLQLRGPIHLAETLGFVAGEDGTLVAFSPASGGIVWRQPIGDVLLDPAQIVGGRIVTASKDNAVRVLDPGSGKELAKFQCPSWLLGTTVLPDAGLVVCTDIRGSVRFLRASDLQVVRQVDLGCRLVSRPFYAIAPPLWADSDEMDDVLPTIITTDADGLLYLLPLPQGQ